jgi:hypothetical protein
MGFEVAGAAFSQHFDMLLPNAPVVERMNFPRLDVGNNSSSTNNSTTGGQSVNLFMDAMDPDMKFVASVVAACKDQTVYAIQCTTAPSYIPTAACGPQAPVSHKPVPPRLHHGLRLTRIAVIQSH